MKGNIKDLMSKVGYNNSLEGKKGIFGTKQDEADARYSMEAFDKAQGFFASPYFIYVEDRKSTRRTPVTIESRMPSSA